MTPPGNVPPPLDERALAAQRVGILGGSFDPPHRGHLHAADAAADAFGLDHVILIPAARPPHKLGQALGAGETRLDLLRILIEGRSDRSVWDGELLRAGPSFTVDTLQDLIVLGVNDPHLIMGWDNLEGFPGWRAAERILQLARPVVIARGAQEDLPESLLSLEEDARERLRAGIVTMPPVEVSSSDLRARMARGEEPTRDLGQALWEHIHSAGLYGAGREGGAGLPCS